MSRVAGMPEADYFLGDVIIESLKDPGILETIKPYVTRQFIQERPSEEVKVWHMNRYRLPKARLLEIVPVLEKGMAGGGWYIHFFAESEDELFVLLGGRTFLLPKRKDESWDEMIRFGEGVGVERRWTENIPIPLPD